ncbi:MAG: hypothetical protein DMG40_04105 [Acidobacteria bacterium]|nr:MAG: hypothetical protein DMG40_04105 [Acidobacteriota bacterium]
MFDPLICSEEDLESGRFRCCEKLPILESGEAGISRGLAAVSRQGVPESLIHASVDEDAHLRACEQQFYSTASRFAFSELQSRQQETRLR